MNLDDESYLSAYLDDELDPADRLAAEWSIESSPILAEQLRSISLARDAVAGLDRPAIPCDLAPALEARLAINRRQARFRALVRPTRMAFALSSFTAVAASLIFAIILLNHSLHDNSDKLKNEAIPEIANADRPHPVENSIPAPESAVIAVASQDHPPKNETQPDRVPPPIVAGSPGLVDEAREQADRRKLAGILEAPNVRRIVIVTDMIDASNRVRELVQHDARMNPEFGRISICQEIVIDPERTEAAEVYAVPMDEQGHRSFVDRLAKLFPNLVEEEEPSPDLVTQLTEVGQVALFRGTQAAPLREPPIDLRPFIAHRTTDSPDHFANPDRWAQVPSRLLDNPAVAKAQSPGLKHVASRHDGEGRFDFIGPPAPKRAAVLQPNEPVLVLVWVTRPTRL